MTNDEKDLLKAILELTKEYQSALKSKYIFKPMAYSLYKVWQHWDKKEHNRLLKGESE